MIRAGHVDQFSACLLQREPQTGQGINWSTGGFQENGIAVTRNGTTYVDNAQGNGYGEATVLVRISLSKRASVAPIRTSLSASLPKLNAPGFPASLYPPRLINLDGPLAVVPPATRASCEFTPAAITAGQTDRAHLPEQPVRSRHGRDRPLVVDQRLPGFRKRRGPRPRTPSPAKNQLEHTCGEQARASLRPDTRRRVGR